MPPQKGKANGRTALARGRYGKFLIADAIDKIKTSHMGAALLVADAENDTAAGFYTKLGFTEFQDIKSRHRKFYYPLTNAILE